MKTNLYAPIQNVPTTKTFLFVILFFNSQIFFFSGGNQLGIWGAQEVFLLFLILYAMLCLLNGLLSGKMEYYDLYVFFMVFIFMGCSSIFAYVQYDQPIIYGLIESRIVTSLLIYFPVKRMMIKGHIGSDVVMNYIFKVTVLIVFFGIVIKIGFFPKNMLMTPPVETGMENLRLDRNSMGRYYIIFSALYSLSQFNRTQKISWGIYFLLFLFAAIFIIQERQIAIGILLSTCFYLFYKTVKTGRLKSIFIFIFGLAGLAFVVGVSLPQKSSNILYMFSQVFSENIIESARFRTLLVIYDHMASDPWIGHGALSLLWNDGFHVLYGDTFHLGDVGIFGTFFRLGLLVSVPVFFIIAYATLNIIRKMDSSVAKDVITLGVLFSLFTLPTSAPIEYRGYFIGLLLGVAIVEIKQSKYKRKLQYHKK